MRLFRCFKPMDLILLALCSFGLIIGFLFPVYASFFVEWIPGRKLAFKLGCLLAGCLVGLFSFYVVKRVLKVIDSYYKKSLLLNLGLDSTRKLDIDGDLLLTMKGEFEKLIENYSPLVENDKRNLQESSIKDCLTSAYNRGYLHEYFEREISGSSMNVSLLFCDIDDFKKVNDQYGHITGDCVLKEVFDTIKKSIYENNKCFRYGGEEFVVLLMNCGVNEAYEIAEDIRLKIQNSKSIKSYCNSKSVTTSIGLASYPAHGLNIESLVDKADKAMYHVKQNGKNSCKIYKDGL